MRKLLIAAFAAAVVVGPSTPAARAMDERPAISARVDTPRDFGYHIGDVIPLALLIEAERGAVVDLESLPHRGETVGPFEVRDVRITRSRSASGSSYRVDLDLQTFFPAMSGVGLGFPPLDLRFALPEDRLADGGYAYRTVTLPPRLYFLSPTATGPRAFSANKPSVVPGAGWLFWGSVGAGAASVATGIGMLGLEVVGWWRRRLAKRRSKAEVRALATLRVIRERYLACEALTPLAFVRVSGVLRRFLGEHCGIPARAETIEQIRERFRGHPLERDLARVLEQCDEVVYDANRPAPSDKERIIREAATLIGELERTGCPTPGDNGASR